MLVDDNDSWWEFLMTIMEQSKQRGEILSPQRQVWVALKENRNIGVPLGLCFLFKKWWRSDETILLPSKWNKEVVVEVGANNEGKVYM